MFKYIKIREWLPYLILTFSIIVLHDFSVEGGVNMLTVGVMVLSGIVLLFNLNKIAITDIGLLLLWAAMYLSAHENRGFRLSTILYSGLFIVQFISLRTLAFTIKHEKYVRFLEKLIYCFLIVLIMQQLSEIIGINGFNRNGKFAVLFKMNSLAQEPSMLPPSIALLFLMYIRMRYLGRIKEVGIKLVFKENKKICLSVAYILLSCGTSSAIILLPIILLFFLRLHVFKYIPFFVITLFVGIIIIKMLYPTTLERISNVLYAIGSLDPYVIYGADTSASARISPYLIYMQSFDISDSRFIFGFGHDYGTHLLSWLLLGRELGYEIGIGGIVNYVYDYGIIIFAAFIFMMRQIVFKKLFSWDFFFWFFAFSMQTFNMPIFWGFFTFTYITKKMEEQVSMRNIEMK